MNIVHALFVPGGAAAHRLSGRRTGRSTLRLYAGRKKLPPQQVRVALWHTKIHSEDRIGRAITLTGEIDIGTRPEF